MCCFTGPVLSVSSTKIFARDAGDKRQYLAYGIDLNTTKEVAMVLPLPVPANSPDDAVKFIDLSGYPTLFTDLYTMMNFPVPTPGKGVRSVVNPEAQLIVQSGSSAVYLLAFRARELLQRSGSACSDSHDRAAQTRQRAAATVHGESQGSCSEVRD